MCLFGCIRIFGIELIYDDVEYANVRMLNVDDTLSIKCVIG